MSYTALYRKFRPDSFKDVKGQDHIVTTLRNQIRANRIGHAYLFTGTRGTGKTTVAKIFAKTVNCENPTEDGPCGACRSCRAIAAGASMNVMEFDAASNNGVDDIRQIVDEIAYSPPEGRYKVYIIDEAHNLSGGAFNALLKTLEEPPSYVIFILATTEVHKIPVTILSRCQRYDFKRITIADITERMKELTKIEQVEAEDKALRFIAREADGSMRDALSLLDQCIAFHLGDKLTYDKVLEVLGAVDAQVFSRLLRYVAARDVKGCVGLLDEVIMQGRELTQFVTEFTWYLRNLMLVQVSEDLEDVIDMSAENLKRLKEEAEEIPADCIMRYIRIFSELSGQIRYASQKRVLVEIALIKLCKPSMEATQDSLLDRIREIEEKLESGAYLPGEAIKNGGNNEGLAKKSGNPENAPGTIRKELPKALPEDIRKIVEKWPSIVAGAGNPMKTHLKTVRLSLGDDNGLVLAVEDGLASDYLTQPGHKEELDRLLTDFAGKEVEATIRVAGSKQEIEQNYVDLSQVIHMEIEEED